MSCLPLRTHHLFTAALLVALSACSADTDDGGAFGPDAGPDAGPEESYADADWLFEPDRLLEIEIEVSEDDWDALRLQTRNILDIFGDTCQVAPAGSPFTYVPATVTVDGLTMENVGLRKKGFLGSLDENKPSLKIKFDKYVADQRLTGLERMTLNNGKQDPAFMDQCLGFQLFADAGVPAPRCNHARVTVNGQPMGIYVHIESVKKAFLGRHFADNDGNLYEGTLSDFRPGWDATFERKTNESDPPGSEDRSDIQAVLDALALADDAMLPALEQVIDLENFYTFWAMEAMTNHWDGYSGNNNNFFIYGDPETGRFTFMPWGNDQLFGDTNAHPAATRSALPYRLYNHEPSRTRYLQRYEELLDQVWDDDALLAEVARVEALIADHVPTADRPAFDMAVSQLRDHLSDREARMRDLLQGANGGDAQPMSDPLCFPQVGDITASFTANWLGGPSANATLEITLDGAPVPVSDLQVLTGPDGEVPGQSVLYITASTSGNRSLILLVGLPDEQVAPGTLELGSGDLQSLLAFFPPGGGDPEEIYFLSGPLTLDAASPSQNAEWRGSLTVTAWDPPWF